MGDKSDKLFEVTRGSKSDALRIWQIKFLEDIAIAVGGGGGGGALATEATLISVLNAIVAADQDIEILLVRDTGNNDEVVQQITDYQTGTPVVSYKDVDGAVYVPVGPLEYLDPSGVLNLILTQVTAINSNTSDASTATLQAVLNALITTLNSTVATEATLASLNSKFTAVTRTPSVSRITTLNGATTIGARSVSFFNAHPTVVATIGGAALNPGEAISFNAGSEDDTLGSITIVVTGGDLIFTQVI